MAPSREALLAAHQGQTTQIRERLVGYAGALWAGLGSWRDEDIARFVTALGPRVLAGRAQVARLTGSYLSASTGSPSTGLVDTATLRGMAVADLYRRPAASLYAALAEGKAFDAAQSMAGTRLKSLVSTDLQLSMTHQARRSLGGSGVEAYRRVLRGRGDCALCVVASTQRYWVKDLLPIHPGCNCDVEPLGAGDHRDHVLDEAQLEFVHDQVQGFTGESDRGGRSPDYRKLIVVREHGEIGPLLTWKHQQFTGLDDLA